MAKILIIDDDPDYREAVKTILESAHHRVVTASGKEEGKSMLASEDPDLVILDIMMERTTSGFHFLYETRGEEEKHVPVLAISSVADKCGFQFTLTTDEDYFPADDYMKKPVKAEELLERVGTLLDKSGAT